MHAREVHAHEMHAREVHAHEVHAHQILLSRTYVFAAFGGRWPDVAFLTLSPRPAVAILIGRISQLCQNPLASPPFSDATGQQYGHNSKGSRMMKW
jgi:hypothetical protein